MELIAGARIKEAPFLPHAAVVGLKIMEKHTITIERQRLKSVSFILVSPNDEINTSPLKRTTSRKRKSSEIVIGSIKNRYVCDSDADDLLNC
jgi:hypothetical protein